MNAPCVAHASSSEFLRARAKQAWTSFWQEGQADCVSAAPDVRENLQQCWAAFAATLAPGARVLDLGCGAGAVARALTAARRDVHVTGVDFARLPLSINPHFELLSDTAMESLPFAEGSFAAIVSQFGYEYSRTDDTAREMARLLAPGSTYSFAVHHAESSILATGRARLRAFKSLFRSPAGAAFCNGDASALQSQLSALAAQHPDNDVLPQLVRTLPLRLARPPAERAAIWKAIEDALAPEQWMLEALDACCVSADGLGQWLAPLRQFSEVTSALVVREQNGDPIAWRIDGVRR
jgi:ubiquinone/menaquinone biosynthesis C-methylase UbiE